MCIRMDLPATEERGWVLVAKFSLSVCLLLLFYVVVTSPLSDMLPGNQVLTWVFISKEVFCMSFIWFCRLWVAASKHSEDWIGWATGATKDEEEAAVEAGGGAARGEDPSQVGLLDEQISGASSVVDDLLLGPAAGVNTVFYFPENPTKCKWQIYTGAWYLTLQIKIGWRNVKTCQFGSAKWFWPNIFAQLVKGIAKPNTCQRRV